MANVDPALGQEIFDVVQREWVSHVHHHNLTDDLRRAVEISERVAHSSSLAWPEGPRAFGLTLPGKLLDMVMLTVTGEEERTASQYSALLDEAGFRMTRVVPTASLVSIVEAVPAGIR